MKKIKNFFGEILNPNGTFSVKSFSMLLTTILGFVLGILLGICLVLDAKDGKIDSDLYGCSAFLVAIGALVSLSSMPKMVVDKAKTATPFTNNEEEETNNEDNKE